MMALVAIYSVHLLLSMCDLTGESSQLAASLLAAVLVVATPCAPLDDSVERKHKGKGMWFGVQQPFVGKGHKVLRPLKRLRGD